MGHWAAREGLDAPGPPVMPMAADALMVSVLLGLAALSALLYLALGQRLGRRQVAPEAVVANHAWQAWWILLAMSTLLGTVFTGLLAAIDRYTLPLALTIMAVNLLMVFAALWGITYYLAYVVTGRTALWQPIAWFYAASATGWLYAIFSSNPVGTTTSGSAELLYEFALESHPLYMTLILALLVPIILAAAAYAYLGFKADDRTVRFRIVMVSMSLIVWFGTSLVATSTRLADFEGWPVFSRLISLGAAILIYLAHFPPRDLERRLGLRPTEERGD